MEAVNCVKSYIIRNPCPTQTLNAKSPFEVWNGKQPDVSDFNKFRCKVLCLKRESRRGRCKQGIFVGYSKQTKGYRIWLTLTQQKKIEVTRDVEFMKSKLPSFYYADQGDNYSADDSIRG